MKILNMLWFKEENGSFSVLVNVLIPIYSSCSATPRCFVWFPYFLCPHVSLDLLLSPFFFPISPFLKLYILNVVLFCPAPWHYLYTVVLVLFMATWSVKYVMVDPSDSSGFP